MQFSVILPVYNGDKTIELAIQSIRKQTYKNFELLIYDDGSTDNTLELITYYAKLDSRIKYWHCDQNKGTGVGRNFLINKTNGKWITIQAADDYSHSNRLEVYDKHIKQNSDYDIFVSEMVHKFPDGRKVHYQFPLLNEEEYLNYFFTSGNFLTDPTLCVLNDIYCNYMYPEGDSFIAQWEDNHFWAHMFDYKIYLIRESLIDYKTPAQDKIAKRFCASGNKDILAFYTLHKILEIYSLDMIFPYLPWQKNYKEAYQKAKELVNNIFMQRIGFQYFTKE